MESSRATELKVGITSLAGITILILGLMWGKHLSYGEYPLSIHFPSSAGLSDKDVINVDGVTKGRLTDINVDTSGGVLVRVMLDQDVHLRSDATARILMRDLMGGRQIDILPGTSSVPFDKSRPLPGSTPMDIPRVVAKLGDMSDDINRVMLRLDTALASANTILGDTQMTHAIKRSVMNLDQTLAMTKSFIADNKADLRTTIVNARDLTMDLKDFMEKNRPLIEHTINSADKTLIDVDATIAHADSTIATVNRIMNDIKNGNGVAGRLIYDKEFATRLDSTLVDARKLVQFILENGVNINFRLGTRP